MLVKRFERNVMGTDYAVGDIHGAFSRLQSALEAIDFDESKDRLFSVGDLVDRGPESKDYWQWLDRPWFHAVRGNHEDMAMRFPGGRMDTQNYIQNGGGWNVEQAIVKQQLAAEMFSDLPVAIEVETKHGVVGIVHADVPGGSWAEFVANLDSADKKRVKDAIHYATWSRGRVDTDDTTSVVDIRALIVGHTPLENPKWLGNVLHIDTGAWLAALGWGRKFTFANLETLETICVK